MLACGEAAEADAGVAAFVQGSSPELFARYWEAYSAGMDARTSVKQARGWWGVLGDLAWD